MALIEINWNPSRRELRQFAGIWFPAFFGVVGGLVLHGTGSWTAAISLWAVGAVVGAIGVVVPRLMRPVWIIWMGASLPIGWVVSHLVMAAIYFGLITPVGLLMRLFGRDPMQRQFEPQAKSYWIPREETSDVSRYFRQY